MDSHIAPGIYVREAAVRWSQVRGGGPGGQHVNTTASTVVLRVALWGFDGLDGAGRDRLRRMAGSRLTQEDELVLRCGTERDAGRNRAILWQRLGHLVQRAAVAPKRRRPTRPTHGSVQRRLTAKSQQAQKKQQRRRPHHEDD